VLNTNTSTLVLSRVWVTYKTGFGLHARIITPYTFTQFGPTGNTALSLFTPLHTH
jgi:hypothetical protein